MQLKIGCLAVLFVAGCSHIPFEETRYVPLENADPVKVVKHYEDKLPENFQLLNSVVIEYNWKKFSGLGLIDINKREATYAIAFLSPMGLKLFELEGNKDRVTRYFIPDQITSRKEFLSRMIGDAVKRTYFDLTPSSGTGASIDKFRIIFRLPSGEGTIAYEFAGPDSYLVEKSYYEEDRLNWRVSYYEYQKKKDGIYPGGIIFNNYQYGYSLTFKLKEVLD